MYMVKLINNLLVLPCIYFLKYIASIYGLFLLLLLKTRSCTEYTVKVVSFKIPVGFNLQWNDYIGKSRLRYIRALRVDCLKALTYNSLCINKSKSGC